MKFSEHNIEVILEESGLLVVHSQAPTRNKKKCTKQLDLLRVLEITNFEGISSKVCMSRRKTSDSHESRCHDVLVHRCIFDDTCTSCMNFTPLDHL